MRAYVAGRLATAVLVILGVSVVSFFLTFLTGDPAEIMLPPGATAAQIEKFRAEWGFDDPLPVQYWRFLKRAVHGDFGISLRHGQASLPLIVARLPATLQLTVTAMLLAIALAVPLGVLAATHRGGPIDLLAMGVALVGQSVPNFWLAIMMILLFAVSWGLLPTSGRGGVAHVVMPATAIAINLMALLTRLVRSTMIEMLSEDYVRTARAKGLRELFVTSRHSRLRRVRVIAVRAALRQCAIRESKAGQTCIAAAQPNFALSKFALLTTQPRNCCSQPRYRQTLRRA